EHARHEFLALIAQQKRADPAVIGGALFILGLFPDFELFAHPGEMAFRVGQQNLLVVDALETATGTLLEKVLSLPISDSAFRDRLRSLFTAISGPVREWGAAIATNPKWRDLSIDRWPFQAEVIQPGQAIIDIAPLPLPHRSEDGLPVYDPSNPIRISWRT